MKFRPNIKKKDQRTGLRIFGRMLLRDSFSRFFMQLFEVLCLDLGQLSYSYQLKEVLSVAVSFFFPLFQLRPEGG